MDVRFERIYCNEFALLVGHDSTDALISFWIAPPLAVSLPSGELLLGKGMEMEPVWLADQKRR
ncbi:hypothetical protein HanHA89_Chr07g0275121 [Helianthus annuus]|nr:hypothetical protein HanHA89_Chr07g0275121 [Helianthus annuus]